MMKRIFPFLMVLIVLTACNDDATEPTTENPVDSTATEQVVNVYTHRHYDVDKELFKEFTEKTGIAVNIQKGKADELITRLENEGNASPCDLLVTVDAANLVEAQQKGLLQPINSEVLNNNVPAQYRSADGTWYAQTVRSRMIVYSKERVQREELSTYEALTQPQWKGRVLVRSSNNVYNQSLLASIIAHHGKDSAAAWAQGIVNNLAQEPKGSDRDQVKFIAAGKGDVALVNTYYIGKLANSDDQAEVDAANAIGVYFPNQGDRGAHVNISGAGVATNAPNKENAIKLLEFLSQKNAQKRFAEANYEYPVNPKTKMSDFLATWGEFKADSIPLEQLGEQNAAAVEIFDNVGWK